MRYSEQRGVKGEEASRFFTNQFFVSTCRNECKFGTITTHTETPLPLVRSLPKNRWRLKSRRKFPKRSTTFSCRHDGSSKSTRFDSIFFFVLNWWQRKNHKSCRAISTVSGRKTCCKKASRRKNSKRSQWNHLAYAGFWKITDYDVHG